MADSADTKPPTLMTQAIDGMEKQLMDIPRTYDPTGRSTGEWRASGHEGTWPDHRCIDCNQLVPYSTEPCAKCRQYACEKCSDPIEGMCLACPERASRQKNALAGFGQPRRTPEEQARGPAPMITGIDLGIGSPPVTYELLAKMIAESESRIRYDQMMKRRAFEERVQMQYRKELDQIREQVAELFKDLHRQLESIDAFLHEEAL